MKVEMDEEEREKELFKRTIEKEEYQIMNIFLWIVVKKFSVREREREEWRIHFLKRVFPQKMRNEKKIFLPLIFNNNALHLNWGQG